MDEFLAIKGYLEVALKNRYPQSRVELFLTGNRNGHILNSIVPVPGRESIVLTIYHKNGRFHADVYGEKTGLIHGNNCLFDFQDLFSVLDPLLKLFPVPALESAPEYGRIYPLSEPEFIGSLPVRSNLTVLSADPPTKKKIGWSIHEISDEEATERDSPENAAKRAAERQNTREADSFITNQAASSPVTSGFCWTSIHVLEGLWGRPWDAAALNFLRALRPSAIRVTDGTVTLDNRLWRVTVFLREDNRTIRSIEQEVEVGDRGFRNGQDASNYLHGHDENLSAPQPTAIFNPRGLKNVKLFNDDEKASGTLEDGSEVIIDGEL